MATYDQSPRKSWLRQHWKTLAVLVLLLFMAGFFRVAFNYGPSYNDGDPRYAGTDDYYHLRATQYVQENGQHLLVDPLLDYPMEGTQNPRPPLFNWHLAFAGRVMEAITPMDSGQAAAYAVLWGSAFWGILSVIVIWLTGRAAYGNAAGLWAGFLLAASPAHIQWSGVGLGDHDAFVMFWILLGVYFLVQAVRHTRTDTPLPSWTQPGALAEGLGAYASAHRQGLAYAFLVGVSWSAVALAWEGFPYVTAVYAVYFVLQVLANHLRHRDSAGDILVMVIVLSTLTLAALPYYWTAGHIPHTIVANAYIVAGMVLVALTLAFTRDLPPVLVLPILAVTGLVTLGLISFVFPDIGQRIFTGGGYFAADRVYSTIAEAQRTEMGVFVFSVGFMTFFLGLVGFGFAVARYFKAHERANLFMVGWGLISIFMAFAAHRFIFNAAPIFAILAGWMAARIVGWMNLRQRVRDFKAFRQESYVRAVRSTLGGRQIAGGLFLGLLLIFPQVWFSVDAGLPSEVRQDYAQNHPGQEFVIGRTGAFGQGFLGRDWIDVYAWLATRDRFDANGNLIPCEERPAHMAWWDYGFYEVALACHPTVADNFQHGIHPSGRFLTAQSEKEAIEWQIIRLLEGDRSRHGPEHSAGLRQVLDDLDPEFMDHLRPGVHGGRNYDRIQRVLSDLLDSTEDAAVFYLRVAEATGTYIGYFLTDQRMLPIDDPSTPFIEAGSIFYAPVFLAERNPDDYVQTVYVTVDGREYRVVVYDVDDEGRSFQLSNSKIIGPDGREYIASTGFIYRLTEDGRRIDYAFGAGQGVQLEAARLDLKAPFYASMYYRGFVGGDGNPPPFGNYHEQLPGNSLQHWRLVRDTPTVKLLQFYLGAPLEGRVTMAGGGAIEGVTVEAVDGFGVAHAVAQVDADGRYRLLLPFSLEDEETGELEEVRVVVRGAGGAVANRSYQVTMDQAMRRAAFDADGDFELEPGTLSVFAFRDRDRDGQYDAEVDEPAEGAIIRLRGQEATADAEGRAVFQNLPPGSVTVNATLDGHQLGSQQATIRSGEATDVEVALRVSTVQVGGVVELADGTPAQHVGVEVTALNPDQDFTQSPPAPVPSDEAGNFTVSLAPGGPYRLSVDETRDEAGVEVTYRGEIEVDVPIGSDAIQVTLVVERTTG